MLLVGSLAVPLLLFVVVARLNFSDAFNQASHDAARTSEVVREHAAKVFDTHKLLADRVIDLLADLDDGAIIATEGTLRAGLVRIIKDLPQVQSLLVVGADGHPLIATDSFPVARAGDFTDRDYFAALQSPGVTTYISKVQVSRVNGKVFFGFGRRREQAGIFAGLVDIAVAPSFFARFYETLIGDETHNQGALAVALVREDGRILVRVPPSPDAPEVMPPGSTFFAAIGQAPDGGSYFAPSAIDRDGPERLFFYRRVQGYPVYAVVGHSTASILAGWYRSLAYEVAFGVPATAAMCLATWVALRRTRREQVALAQAREETHKREAAENALRQMQRLESVGLLTGGVAHDFNNLLTIVQGNLEMMVSRPDDPARVRRLGSNALNATRRGGEITHKLLAFARRQLVRPETVDLNRLLRDFLPLLAQGAGEMIVVSLDLAPDLDAAWLDPGQFEAVILNLVINARDATPGGGRVVIATSRANLGKHEVADLPAGRYARVAVSDFGSGMDTATAERAFEPFFTTKDVGRGTGLGLSQAYGFTKQAGGHVSIRTAPGAGTTVELLLPRSCEGVATGPGPISAGTLRPASDGEVVLVVEDEPSVLEMATESLCELGYRVCTAMRAETALAWLRGPGRIDVLFSDVVMPGGMNGIELALEARRLRPSLKLLLTSGYAASSLDYTLPRDAALLPKPYDRSELAVGLRAVLEGSAATI